MRHEHENARRHAYNTLAEVNRHLDRGNIRNPRHHQMLTDMAEKATRTLDNLDKIEDRRPYSDTNIGYNVDVGRRYRTSDDISDMINDTMDAINRILPHIADDFEGDVDMRQGVPGTGPYANPRLRRRGGRKGIGRRRADLDDGYDVDDRYNDDRYDDVDDRYDDDRYADVDARRGGRRRRDSRGRFVRSDYDRYDDIARVAADAAADTARRIVNDRNDTRGAHPNTPVMTRSDDIRSDRRYNADDTTSDRAHRPGPI